jgi:hypothetical protein
MEKEIKKSQKLINKIVSEDIKPSPRWHFIFKNYILWIVFILFMFFGGIAFSIILYGMAESDFGLFFSLSYSKVQFLIASLPILWVIFLIIFLVVSISGIRHTRTGYRYPLFKILSINIVISILLGVTFFYSGGAERIEKVFAENIPAYRGIEENKSLRWSDPENGLLAGVIMEDNVDTILIEDLNGKKWEIITEEMIISQRVSLEIGEKIKIIGKILEDNIFTASEIRSWEGMGLQRGK